MASKRMMLCASVMPIALWAASPFAAHAQPVTATPSPPVPAQTPQPAPSPPPASGANTVTEVIVTAQKRAQNLQDVPVVVTVLNTRQLQDANVRDIKDLTVLTPGLTVTSTGSENSTTARIRGVGTVSDNVGLEDQVGVVIDGVVRARNGVAFNDLGELSDIEVLKGPQGTLFGANTTAGVIAITTARPSFTFGGAGELQYGNYNTQGAALSVTGPLVADKLAGRLYVAGRSHEGYYEDEDPNGVLPRLNDEHLYTARGQILWTPRPDFDINFIGDYTKRNDHSGGSVPISDGITSPVLNAITPGSTAVPAVQNSYVAYGNVTNIENVTDKGISAEAHWKTPWLGGATLTSITAARDYKDQSGGGDTDATGVDLLQTLPGTYTEFKQYTQELRYQGHTDKLDWIVGGFFKYEHLDTGGGLIYGSQYDEYLQTLVGALTGGALDFNAPLGGNAGAFPTGSGTRDTYRQHENSEAFFTQETYKLTDKLELTGGFRYTFEHKSIDTLYTNFGGSGAGCTAAKATLGQAGFNADPFSGFYCVINDNYNSLPSHQKLTESEATGTAKAAYRFNPDLLTYASYSRGYLVGGFNLARTSLASAAGVPNSNAFAVDLDTAFKPTFVNAYELGEKATLFGRRLTLDGALFYQDYSDFQLNAFNGLVFVVTSVPEVISRGAEIESAFRATHDLSLNFGATYSDSYFPDSSQNKAALNAGNGLYRLPGHRLSLAPLFSIVGGASYEHPVTNDLLFDAAVDVKYQSTVNTGSDLDPVKVQRGYQIWDTNIGIGPRSRLWNLSASVQNLFNQPYTQVAYNGALQTLSSTGSTALNTYNAFLGIPRRYSMTLRFKY